MQFISKGFCLRTAGRSYFDVLPLFASSSRSAAPGCGWPAEGDPAAGRVPEGGPRRHRDVRQEGAGQGHVGGEEGLRKCRRTHGGRGAGCGNCREGLDVATS